MPRSTAADHRPGHQRPWIVWLAAGALAVTLALAYVGKAVCIGGEAGFWGQTRYCYSDVRVLWSFRGFDVDALPYAGAPEGYVEDYTLEYPPGLAFPAHLIGLLTDSRRGFFDLHALSFAIATFLALYELDRALVATGRSRWRLFGLALSPALVLFGMQNWDLWAVALVAGGLSAAARRRPDRAAVWLGLAAAVKWWPALLVVLLVAGPWSRLTPGPGSRATADRSGWLHPDRIRPALIAAATWTLAQVPALLISPRGWWDALAFHLRRAANLDSFLSAVSAAGQRIAPGRFWEGPFTTLVTVAFVVLLAAVTAYVVWRLDRGTLDPGDAALALVATFLLTSKVFSPQFVLWLLPVAVVATVSWTPVLAVEAANAGVWLLYGPWMGNIDDPAFTGFLRAAQGMTVVRTAAVAWLVVAALSARREEPDEETGHRADRRQQAEVALA